MKYFFIIFKNIKLFILKILDKSYTQIYKYMPGLTLGKNVIFWGKPLIDIRLGGQIVIGKDTRLISTNIGTHVNYGAPTKLFVDRPDAKIVIGDNCSIGGACLHAYKMISVGDNCIIASNTNIIDTNGHPVHLDQYENRRILIDDAKPIIIEKNVWIALNCVILPGTNIGKGSIVGANSVVHGNIPAYSIVVGNPAVVVGKIRIK